MKSKRIAIAVIVANVIIVAAVSIIRAGDSLLESFIQTAPTLAVGKILIQVSAL